jgi:hypothetical protein
LLFLSFAAFVAHADGPVKPSQREWLASFVHSAKVGDAARTRLDAHLQWLLAVPPEFGVLRSRLALLPTDDRHQLGTIALAVACTGGSVAAKEVKALQRIYKVLGLDSETVIHDVHALMAGAISTDQLIPIQVGQTGSGGFAIPKPEPAPAESVVQLDAAKIRQVSENTQRVSAVLARIFATENTEENIAEEEHAVQSSGLKPMTSNELHRFPHLHPQYEGFVRELLARREWPRQDVDTLARSFGLMTDGAIEAVNEWAFDQYGDVLVENEEPMTINRKVMEQEASSEGAHA